MHLDDAHVLCRRRIHLVVAVPEIVVSRIRLLVSPITDSRESPTPIALISTTAWVAPTNFHTHVVEAPIVAVIHEDEISLQERIVLLRWGHADEIGSDRAARMASALLIAHEKK